MEVSNVPLQSFSAQLEKDILSSGTDFCAYFLERPSLLFCLLHHVHVHVMVFSQWSLKWNFILPSEKCRYFLKISDLHCTENLQTFGEFYNAKILCLKLITFSTFFAFDICQPHGLQTAEHCCYYPSYFFNVAAIYIIKKMT